MNLYKTWLSAYGNGSYSPGLAFFEVVIIVATLGTKANVALKFNDPNYSTVFIARCLIVDTIDTTCMIEL